MKILLEVLAIVVLMVSITMPVLAETRLIYNE
jgi:hypothetical protein